MTKRRSRRHLPPGTVCYLCGKPILEHEDWNRDHVPPERFFGQSVKQHNSVDLHWLPTHTTCNSAYRSDEEYFVMALAGQQQTAVAMSVWADIKRGVEKGHGKGLLRNIVGAFGKVIGIDGSVVFALDSKRAGRIAWKLVRGLYFMLTEHASPEDLPRSIEFIPHAEGHKLKDHPWFWAVRDTPSLFHHAKVFDYKWLCVKDAACRMNLVALLLWDGLVILVVFHDPTCPCPKCGN
jgi:hypothetical protein